MLIEGATEVTYQARYSRRERSLLRCGNKHGWKYRFHGDISPLTGKELVAQKVKLLCTMGGCFDNSNPLEYNIVKDIPAAQKVFAEWPTRLVTSPFEVGIKINYPASSIEKDFQWATAHPMVEAYKSYQKMPYDRPTWDLTSVLYAVEGPSYFNISAPGHICHQM